MPTSQQMHSGCSTLQVAFFLSSRRLGYSLVACPVPRGSHRDAPSVTIVTALFSAGIEAGRRLELRFLRLTTLGKLSEIWFEEK